jgi:phage gpG-like protein
VGTLKVNYTNASQTLAALEHFVSVEGTRENLYRTGRYWQRRVDLQFSDSRDPYGNPWAPSKKGQGKTLIQTSLLRRSIATQVDGTVLRIGVRGPAIRYASTHQYGAPPVTIKAADGRRLRFVLPDGTVVFAKQVKRGAIPQRIIVPTERGLPDAWEADVRRAFTFKEST